MARPGDRRPRITDEAILVLAAGGARALTHQAVDRSLGLAPGSTSYYFRTRRDLVVATIDRIREHSRAAFAEAMSTHGAPPAHTADAVAAAMEQQLMLLAGPRRDDALAVFALLPEVERDAELRARLAASLFSRERAAEMLTAFHVDDVESTSIDVIDFLSGILFGLLFGHRRSQDTGETSIAGALQRFLRGVMPADSPASG